MPEVAPVSEGKCLNELERLTNMDVVTPVATLTDWITSLVVVAKSNNKTMHRSKATEQNTEEK